jgi:hypothetical protein
MISEPVMIMLHVALCTLVFHENSYNSTTQAIGYGNRSTAVHVNDLCCTGQHASLPPLPAGLLLHLCLLSINHEDGD